MYAYNIRENGFIIGRVTGKKRAFAFILALLKLDNITGFWLGLKCVTNDKTRNIQFNGQPTKTKGQKIMLSIPRSIMPQMTQGNPSKEDTADKRKIEWEDHCDTDQAL